MKHIYTYQYKEDLFIRQPKLSSWMIKYKGKFLVHNNMIWDKCIKSKIYKKALYLMGYLRISTWAEDTSVLFIIFKLAKSFQYIYKYRITHFKGNITATKTQSIESKIFGDIFFLDIIFDFSKNNNKMKNLKIGQTLYI